MLNRNILTQKQPISSIAKIGCFLKKTIGIKDN